MSPPPMGPLSFTLPSLHDGTLLDCRIYLPSSSSSSSSSSSLSTRLHHAAVVAHPYAPLGGSFDDHIVLGLVRRLRTRGFVVATFNFRGATRRAYGATGKTQQPQQQQGHTSWTAKPETGDYTTVAGFLYYFIHHLPVKGGNDDNKSNNENNNDDDKNNDTNNNNNNNKNKGNNNKGPIFLFAGYSYGAMVTSLLPSLPQILARLARPPRNSAASEVRRRAARLAASLTRTRKTIRVGGSEDNAWRRRSQELTRRHHTTSSSGGGSGSATNGTGTGTRTGTGTGTGTGRRSLSTDDRGHVRLPDAGASQIRKSMVEDDPDTDDSLPVVDLLPMRPAYLLVSPPVGVVTNLATMSLWMTSTGMWNRRKKAGSSSTSSIATTRSEDHNNDDSEAKLANHPTLVVFGSADAFLSTKRMRQWIDKMTASGKAAAAAAAAAADKKEDGQTTTFRAREIATAGHFWTEGRTLYEMEETVDAFVTELVGVQTVKEEEKEGDEQ